MSIKVMAFSGSLRKESFTTKLLLAFKESSPQNIQTEIAQIDDLPLINQDLENDFPAAVKSLHRQIESTDAFLFATPEYNRSYSPVIKNVIDWGSRPLERMVGIVNRQL